MPGSNCSRFDTEPTRKLLQCNAKGIGLVREALSEHRPMHRIVTLAVGSDSPLLETCNQVLRSDGHTVVSALSIEQASKEFAARDFDLVVLCHSIPEQERERFTKAIHSRTPNTLVVLVSQRLAGKDPFTDATVDLRKRAKNIPSNTEEPDNDAACA
jgi:PleD family two-component response regulator